jgi:integrase
MDDDWGTLVWLVMTTGIRRGEVCALRWRDVDLDDETIAIRRSYTLHKGVGVEKDTKTHQMRRIALDSETVALLREHRERVRSCLSDLSAPFSDQTYVFTGVKTPDHSRPYSPHAVSSRYKEMAERLDIETHLHSLRHYSATELLSAGVDLRTVAGRLGHGGGERRRSACTRRGLRHQTGRRPSSSGVVFPLVAPSQNDRNNGCRPNPPRSDSAARRRTPEPPG